jgi:hypothetical protein
MVMSNLATGIFLKTAGQNYKAEVCHESLSGGGKGPEGMGSLRLVEEDGAAKVTKNADSFVSSL